jgi:flagellar biosynthesis protein FlhA
MCKNSLDSLAKDHPKVIEEAIPNHITLGGVQGLQNLLREEVPVRDLLTIVKPWRPRPHSKIPMS